MINFLKRCFSTQSGKTGTKPENNDFSDFFAHAKSKDKAKIIRQVLREANSEQRAVIEKYKALRR